jgi:hypothetical protein
LGGRQQIGYAAAVEKAGDGVGGGVDDASSVRGRVVRRFIVTEQRGGRGALMGGAVVWYTIIRSSRMVHDHTYLTWFTYSNISCSRQQI